MCCGAWAVAAVEYDAGVVDSDSFPIAGVGAVDVDSDVGGDGLD